jgi:cell division protease FtsH
MNLSSTARQIVFWLLIIAGALLLYKLVNPRGSTYKTVALTEMDQMIQSGNLKSLTVKQNESVAIDNSNQEYRAALSNEFSKRDLLNSAREVVNGKPRVPKVEEESSSSYIWPMLITWAPLLFIIAIWIFMLRQMQSGGNKALSFGKSRAKLLNNQQKRVTFKDVAGVEEAKEELQEIIEFLKEPQKFQKLGGRIP